MSELNFDDMNDLDNILIWILDNSTRNPDLKQHLDENNINGESLEILINKVKHNLEALNE